MLKGITLYEFSDLSKNKTINNYLYLTFFQCDAILLKIRTRVTTHTKKVLYYLFFSEFFTAEQLTFRQFSIPVDIDLQKRSFHLKK